MPVVIMAEDLEDYACKYDHTNKLINEFIAHQFLQQWNLRVFPAAFINIKREHVPNEHLQGRLRLIDFDKPTFGSRYNNDAFDASNILMGLKNDNYVLSKFSERFDLLKIALFDLWLANDDRNHNNYNLMIVENEFVPIDHSNIFDGGRLGGQLAQLTEDDSLLNSDLALTFLNHKARVEAEGKKLIQTFLTFVHKCDEILPKVVEDIPDEWCSDKNWLLENIRSSVIDNKEWLKQTISSFSQLIHTFIR